jgi:outer membrane protein assembly factor BamB
MQCRWVFPPSGQSPCPSGTPEPAKGVFAASPVLNSTEARIYIGSTDGTLYALNTSDGTQNTNFNFSILGTEPITSTALLATRDNGDAVYVGGGDGLLYGLTATGSALADNWPALIGNLISASPTLGNDGTVYVASLAGLLAGVCPNGVERFVLSYAGIQSSPAQGADATLYFGADDSQLHAVQPDGPVKWTFSAAGPILAAPVFDLDTNSVYVADTAGFVFKVGTDGKAGRGPGAFQFPLTPEHCARLCFGGVNAERPCAVDLDCPGSSCSKDCGIASSPAVAEDHLYFGSNDGYLYAINKCTGHTDWKLHTGGEIVSSPAVALGGPTSPTTCPLSASPVVHPRIVVVGSNDGNVYFVEDKVDASGSFVGNVGTFPIGSAVRSSPAIGSDGTVYVGADDGRLYAIASP